MRWGLSLPAFAAIVAVLVPAAQATTEPIMEVPVHVTLRDNGITMTPKSAPRGSAAIFIVSNAGKKTHAFAVGEGQGAVAMPANISYKKGLATRPMKPGGKRQVVLVFLDYRGTLSYYSWVKPDANDPRFRGHFTIE